MLRQPFFNRRGKEEENKSTKTRALHRRGPGYTRPLSLPLLSGLDTTHFSYVQWNMVYKPMNTILSEFWCQFEVHCKYILSRAQHVVNSVVHLHTSQQATVFLPFSLTITTWSVNKLHFQVLLSFFLLPIYVDCTGSLS